MKVTSRTQSVAMLMILIVLPACVPVVRVAGVSAEVPVSQALLGGRDDPARPIEILGASKPEVTHTDRNPIPVSLPRNVGDRRVLEPVETSEESEEAFAWGKSAVQLGVFDPVVALLEPKFPVPFWRLCP